MRKRHDTFLKLMYRVGARDAVTLFFPDLAVRIDWTQLRWVEKEIPIWDPSPPSGATARGLRARSRSVVADLVGVTRDVEGRYLEVFLHPEIQREPYVTRDNPMGWALAAWMQHPRRGQAEQRLRLQERILRFETEDEYYRRMLLDAVQTYYRLGPAEQAEEQRLLQTERYREVPEMLNTVLGRREAEAEERGRRAGGREALQNVLLEVLRSRFPVSPERLETHLRRVEEVEALQQLIVRAATAETLEEIEALPP